jgi:drug/metabolite transporter (DMT)-like permease
LTLLSLTSWTGYTIYGKRVLERLSPEVATTGAYLCGTLMLIPLALLTVPLFPPPRFTGLTAWMVVLYQAVTGAVAHVWWYKAVERIGASRSAIFQNLTPVVGVILAATLLREPLEPSVIIGGALVLVGVALTTSGLGRPRRR